MYGSDKNWWKSQSFRRYIAKKIQDAIADCDAPFVESGEQLESRLFKRAKNKDTYFYLVMHLIKRIRKKGAKQQLFKDISNAKSPKEEESITDDMEESHWDFLQEEKCGEEMQDLPATRESKAFQELSYDFWRMTVDVSEMLSMPSCSYYNSHNFIMQVLLMLPFETFGNQDLTTNGKAIKSERGIINKLHFTCTTFYSSHGFNRSCVDLKNVYLPIK